MAARDTVLEEFRRLAGEVAARHGLEIVEVVFRRQGKHSLLRLDVDRPGAAGIRIEDCERVSREIETVLDDIDLIPESYELQVSSPGTDRPIRTDDDVRRNSGRRVLVDTSAPVEGEVRFRGVLVGLESDSLRLRLDDGRVVALPRTLVAVARQDVDFDLHARRDARRRQQ